MLLRRIPKGVLVKYNYIRLLSYTARLCAEQEIVSNAIGNGLYHNTPKQQIPSKAILNNSWVYNSLTFNSSDTLQSTLFKEIKKCLLEIGKKSKLQGMSEANQTIWNEALEQVTESLKEQLQDSKIWQSAQDFQKQDPILLNYIKPNHRDLLKLILSMNNLSKSQWSDLLSLSNYTITDQIYYLIHESIQTLISEIEQDKLKEMTKNSVIDALDKPYIPPPNEWFPEANKMRRHIILHLGPTNSGKTYKALQKLIKCENGYYGGPLRLLAREIYDKFQNQGINCNLLTGEEIIPGFDSMGNRSGLTCGTIEMIPLNRKFDVVVLDEIQMLADETRGSSWSNALLGVQANEIHLCGEPSVLPLIKKLVDMKGDKLTVNNYQRLGKLVVESEPINHNYQKFRKGDCLVAFSKSQILALKLKIQRKSNLKAAVIYGSLPPETRLQQAKLFNQGHYDVLIASDAIGMGLNLNIDRIIFTTSMKFNGTENIPLTVSTIKQIGGRAGRFKDDGTENTGYITAMDNQTLVEIKKAMETEIRPIEKMVVWPPDEVFFNLYSSEPNDTKVSKLLRMFVNTINSNRNLKNYIFECPDVERIIERIKSYEYLENLNLMDKLVLCTAPVKNDPLVAKTFFKFCESIANKRRKSILEYGVPFFKLLDYQQIIEKTGIGLTKYESLYSIIMLFCWLSNKYPEYFIDRESALQIKLLVELIIFEKIERIRQNPYVKHNGSSPYLFLSRKK